MIRNVTKSAKKSDPKNMIIILCNSEDEMMIFATNFVDQFFPFCSSFISRPLFFIWPPSRKSPIILKKDMLIEQLKCKKFQYTFSV